MNSRLTIQKRLILPVLLLGIVAFLSNVLSIFNINHVNANASQIVDDQMAGAAELAEIRCSLLNIHKMALSHIVASDYSTMITVVTQIKEEQKALDDALASYEKYVMEEEASVYAELKENYIEFKHSLVRLVCASASSKTEEAYACANDEVAVYGAQAEENIEKLVSGIEQRTDAALSLIHI